MGSVAALWIDKKPTDRPIIGALSYVAAVGVGAGGYFMIYVSYNGPFYWFGLSSGAMAVLGVIGVIDGLIIVVSGVVASLRPARRRGAGMVILVLSLASFFTSWFGLFFIGPVAGAIAGTLSIRRAPKPAD